MTAFVARLRASPFVIAGIGVVLCATVATAMLVVEHRRLLARSGLSGDYRAGAGWDGKPEFTVTDRRISADLIRSRSRDRNGAAFTVTWRGYLVVPRRDRYRFSILADDHAWIEVDKRPVIDSDRRRRESAVELSRGLHPITIRYYDGFGLQDLDLRWAHGNRPTDQIPKLFLVPQLVTGEEAQHRIRIQRIASILPLTWSAVIAVVLAACVTWRCTFANRPRQPIAFEMLLVYVAALALFGTGISWGLPDYRGWAVDEITPGEVQDFLEHKLGNQWATIYPPLHFGVLSVASAPVYAARAVGLLDDTLATYSQLFRAGRAVSVAMAICILALVYRLTRDEHGHRSGLFAVVVALLILPLTYYSKTANLDVPYLFWLTSSWLFYLRAVRTRSVANACLFAATGAAAIATKDQAYGFYVLPAAHIAFETFRRADRDPPSAFPGRRAFVAMTGVFVATTVILFNVPFNLAGVVEHLRLIVGPGSQPYRMYPASAAGYAALVRDSVWQIGSAMSWPMFGAGLYGLVVGIRDKSLLVRRLWLSAASYYLTFIVVVMYHYDRFFIGICLVLAMAAGMWLDRFTRAGVSWRRLRLACVIAAVGYGGARVVSLDALMIDDSRYHVERWMVPQIGPDTCIAAEGSSIYLPRQSVLLWTRIDAAPPALRDLQPQFLLVNAGSRTRASLEPGPNAFYRSLSDGRAHYRQVLSYRTELWWSPLNWETRFNGPGEDPFSNVTKVNPTIEVYERVDVTAQPLR